MGFSTLITTQQNSGDQWSQKDKSENKKSQPSFEVPHINGRMANELMKLYETRMISAG